MLGINLNFSFTMILHRLRESTGIWEKVIIVGVLANDDASDRDSLVNERVTKYTARILFFKVIAYMLRTGVVSVVEGCR